MDTSNSPDKATPPPADFPLRATHTRHNATLPPKAALRATPGQFDWIRMHPSFSSPGGSSSTSPSTLNTADRRVSTNSNHASPFENNSRGAPERPPHRPDHLKSTTPAIAPRPPPRIKQRTTHASSYPDISSGPSSNPNSSTLFARPNIPPTDAQPQLNTSLHENDWRKQFRLVASNPNQPNSQSSLGYPSRPVPTQQMPSYESGQIAFNGSPGGPSRGWSDPSSLGLPRSQQRTVKRTEKSKPPTKGPLRISSIIPSLDPTHLESIDPRLIEVDAPNPRRRSLSQATSEDNESTDEDRIDDFSSDDEDYREYQRHLVKTQKETDILRGTQIPGRRKDDIVARGGYRGHRGPRKAAEPTGDIKARLGEAAKAFLGGHYPEAFALCQEIIRINAETHEAWTTLASCCLEMGNRDKALIALTFAAHLEPKNVQNWIRMAGLFLEEEGKLRESYLLSAHFCYGAALRTDTNNIEARLGKAKIYVERNRPASAIKEYEKVLCLQPHNLELIRDLCAAYYDDGKLERAAKLYKETFGQFMANRSTYKDDALDWSDLDSYIAIHQQLDQHSAAIEELKLISRWFLHRGSEDFWDDVTNDDREWDADNSRRVEITGYTEEGFPLSTYGDGLPLELRAKLGISRLELGQHGEAMRHFEWLKVPNKADEDKVLNFFDLYRQIADTLRAARLYQHALEFYEPLKRVPGENTANLHIQMGYCFLGDKLQGQAEECFQAAIQLDENNIEARMELAKLYESLNEQEQAFIYVNEVMKIQNCENPLQPLKRRKRGRKPKVDEPSSVQGKESKETSGQASDDEHLASTKQPNHKRLRLADPQAKLEEEMKRAEQLQFQYRTLRSEREEMLNGNREAARAWMMAARDLTDDFRSVRSFYPFEKYVRFIGYKVQESRAGADVPLDDEATAMAERLSNHLGADIADKTHVPKIEVPEDYRGIPFNSWLDIFLDFALCLARHGKMKESYEMCQAAKDCALWYHCREDLFLIHLAWMTCAVFVCDEETCVNVSRFFMKDYQFTTDSYRMFTAVSRMVHSPVSWYSSGPSQKFILRQIKAMDYVFADEDSRVKYFNERGSYSAVDENGQLIINDDLDIALLMSYGHILYAASSYIYAMNYFLRALALDPESPMINLSVGLAYVHYALRRQAENRQHLILQGMTFMLNYYNSRKTSTKTEERQEAHYNMARVYHMLGLTNLAVPFYDQVFKEIESGGRASGRDDLVTDAAYNLQSIYAMSGNEELANAITRKWLVI